LVAERRAPRRSTEGSNAFRSNRAAIGNLE
jgi:hypothetical protein